MREALATDRHRRKAAVRQHTDGRALWVLGEPGVNVLGLNLAVDKEFPLR